MASSTVMPTIVALFDDVAVGLESEDLTVAGRDGVVVVARRRDVDHCAPGVGRHRVGHGSAEADVAPMRQRGSVVDRLVEAAIVADGDRPHRVTGLDGLHQDRPGVLRRDERPRSAVVLRLDDLRILSGCGESGIHRVAEAQRADPADTDLPVAPCCPGVAGRVGLGDGRVLGEFVDQPSPRLRSAGLHQQRCSLGVEGAVAGERLPELRDHIPGGGEGTERLPVEPGVDEGSRKGADITGRLGDHRIEGDGPAFGEFSALLRRLQELVHPCLRLRLVGELQHLKPPEAVAGIRRNLPLDRSRTDRAERLLRVEGLADGGICGISTAVGDLLEH